MQLLQKSGLLDRFIKPIETVLQETGTDVKSLDAIEWVGSAMRAVPVQDAITKYLGRPMSSTQNAEEALAKGCALQCAILSPLMKVRDYKLIDTQNYKVNVLWRDLDNNNDGESNTCILFDKKQQLNKTKYITFTRKESKAFRVYTQYANLDDVQYKDCSNNGVIANGSVKNILKPDEQVKDSEIRVKVRLDGNGVTYLDQAELVEKKEVTVEVPIEEPKKEEKKEEPKKEEKKEGTTDPMETDTPNPSSPDPKEPEKPKTKTETKLKTFYTKIDILVQYSQLPEQFIETAKETESQLTAKDNYANAVANSKNLLETTVYSTRDKLSGIWCEFAVSSDKDSINDLTQKIEDWLYDEGSDESKENYDKKLADIKKLTDPIHKRCYEWEHVPNALKSLTETINYFLAEATSGDEKYAHIPKEELDNVSKECNSAMEFINKSLSRHQSLKKTDEPVFSSKDILHRRENLTSICQAILSKPKPAPPKEEPKKEEPKKEEPKPEEPKKEDKKEEKTEPSQPEDTNMSTD